MRHVFSRAPAATGRRTLVAAAAVALGAIGLGTNASAVTPTTIWPLGDSTFEIDKDANVVANNEGYKDWVTVAAEPAPTPPAEPAFMARQDITPKSADNSFTQGTKEDTAVPVIETGSIPPNKSDLTTFGVYHEKINGHLYISLFWSRVQDPTGTTNMDFELNQSETLSANGVTPVRTPGDLLITYDLAKGGTVPVLNLWEWTGTAWQPHVPGLNDAGETHAVGSINSTAIPQVVSGTTTFGPYSVRTFGEATIDLSSVLTPGTCVSYGSVYLKSRSSDSFTAALKDFIAPIDLSVTNCRSINVLKVDDSNPAVPLAGVEFALYTDAAMTHQYGETKSTNADGDLEFTKLVPGTYWVKEVAAPAGYQLADPQWQQVVLTDAADQSITFVDPRLPATVEITKTAKNHSAEGGVAPLAGAVFTLYTDAAPIGGTMGTEDVAVSPAITCTTGTDGTCSLTDILPPGAYWVKETSTPTGYTLADPQHVTLALDQTVALSFVDTPLSKVTLGFESSAGAGVTAATVQCTGMNEPVSLTSYELANLVPGTYTCTIVVDP